MSTKIFCGLAVVFMTLAAGATSNSTKRKPAAVEAESTMFSTEEEVRFVDRDDPIWGMMRSPQFLGTFFRSAATQRDFAQVSVYSLPLTEKIAVDDELCTQGAESALGAIKGPFRLGGIKFFDGPRGRLCEVTVTDSDPKTLQPEHRVFVAFLQANPFAFQVDLSRATTGADAEEIRTFVQRLTYRAPGPAAASAKKKAASR